ncbi:hypothetical protein L596_006388 [Steinernema carpocapsae]|uniref:Uncharacterized protein n=1 Tax=Steinernema carpocapsae TaxID=34508 RepID=A0A4U8V212_STECR|nr:hypothetical protein L596_006388 [Steinernema carpocapsae]
MRLIRSRSAGESGVGLVKGQNGGRVKECHTSKVCESRLLSGFVQEGDVGTVDFENAPRLRLPSRRHLVASRGIVEKDAITGSNRAGDGSCAVVELGLGAELLLFEASRDELVGMGQARSECRSVVGFGEGVRLRRFPVVVAGVAAVVSKEEVEGRNE